MRLTIVAMFLLPRAAHSQDSPKPRVIEVLADHDSRYKIAGMKIPMITVHANEVVTLRITARKAKNRNRDGSVHGFTLLRAKDRSRVPGWDFLLKPGVQEFTVKAPSEPGEYVVVRTVICSDDHEGMHMRFVVLP
jgi:heme/copper-type cytochrome/quinol oxidase subunit 2